MDVDKDQWIAMMTAASKNNAMEHNGVSIVDASEDHIEIAYTIGQHSKQPAGLLHGGVTMFLMESAASMQSCWGLDLTKTAPVGIEINGSHMRSATEGEVRTIARVVRRSRTLVVHDIEVRSLATGKTLSVGRVTNLFKSVG